MDSSLSINCLPCRTLISTGHCPYKNKCTFIHDLRCINYPYITNEKQKNKFKTNSTDMFFWSQNSTHSNFYNINDYDMCTKSIWMHFLFFLNMNGEFLDESLIVKNVITNRSRLPIFIELSNSI